MGIDCLDFACRMEKRLQIPVRPQHLFLGHHTTVTDVVELLWQRLHGLELAEDLELIRLYHELHTRLKPGFLQSFRDSMMGSRRDERQLNDIIPPLQRAQFWESLSRDYSCPLPPLTSCADDTYPRFPIELSTPRSLLQFVRTHLFQRIQWVPITPPANWDPIPIMGSLIGLGGRAVQDAPPRDTPWTREELFDVVRQELVETLSVDWDEVTPDAELIGDLGME